jgi:hypothetical protein
MAHGGKRRGAGRKPGTGKAARLDLEVREAAKAAGELPAEYMLRIMRDEGVDDKRRDAMAAAAAPYYHAKLASIEHKGDKDAPLTVEIVELKVDAITKTSGTTGPTKSRRGWRGRIIGRSDPSLICHLSGEKMDAAI